MQYVLGDNQHAVVGAECLPDLLYLTRADVGKVREDDLLVRTEQFVQLGDRICFLFPCLCSTSHSIILY